MSDNPFADPAAMPLLLATLAMGTVIIVSIIALIVWTFIIEPRRERRRISRGRK